MQDYIIFTESTADLTKEQMQTWKVEVLPLSYTIDGRTYYNDKSEHDIPSKEFFALLNQGKLSTTAQVNISEFKEKFEKALKEGNDILYIGFSSSLSGTYNSANIAAEELKKEYPERKIILIDSLAASMGEGLLVYYAAQKRDEGWPLEKTTEFIEKIKLNINHWFMVDDLFHLKRSGRVSSTAALFGTMLGIRPVLHVDPSGKLTFMEKARGRKAGLATLLEKTQTLINTQNCQIVAIVHANVDDDAQFLANQIKETLKIKEVLINPIGPVVGTHVGQGTIAVLFLGKEPRRS